MWDWAKSHQHILADPPHKTPSNAHIEDFYGIDSYYQKIHQNWRAWALQDPSARCNWKSEGTSTHMAETPTHSVLYIHIPCVICKESILVNERKIREDTVKTGLQNARRIDASDIWQKGHAGSMWLKSCCIVWDKDHTMQASLLCIAAGRSFKPMHQIQDRSYKQRKCTNRWGAWVGLDQVMTHPFDTKLLLQLAAPIEAHLSWILWLCDTTQELEECSAHFRRQVGASNQCYSQ